MRATKTTTAEVLVGQGEKLEQYTFGIALQPGQDWPIIGSVSEDGYFHWTSYHAKPSFLDKVNELAALYPDFHWYLLTGPAPIKIKYTEWKRVVEELMTP